ncbi:hypothetical protein ACFOZ5_02370 [Marinobacter lacisalsi]|uniref:Transmembrane protein n=1 Tax=Marinobacter lacisalsi TaxID=475979 RepID=A0ABV8QBY6_9GAMM
MFLDAQYYSPAAYHSDRDGEKVNRERAFKKSRFDESRSMALRWGGTKDVIPSVLLRHKTPEDLKNPHQETDLDRQIQNESREDHECILHAPYPFRIWALMVSESAGRILFYLMTPLAFLVFGLDFFIYEEISWEAIFTTLREVWLVFFIVSGLPLLMWTIPLLILAVSPRWLGKKGQGPEWELNRRTGMVRVWHYPRRLSRHRKPDITEHPFTDYEAAVSAAADQYGPWYHFILRHRISGEYVKAGTVIGPQRNLEQCYALWDFLQNYMDVSRPLPDVPFLEPHRHKDPVTAEHDEKVGRPADYWRDMDMATFEQRAEEMEGRVRSIRSL